MLLKYHFIIFLFFHIILNCDCFKFICERHLYPNAKKCYLLIALRENAFNSVILPKLNRHIREQLTREAYYDQKSRSNFLVKTNQFMNRIIKFTHLKVFAHLLNFNCFTLSRMYILRSEEAVVNYRRENEAKCFNGHLIKINPNDKFKRMQNKFLIRHVKKDAE
ncbi:Hypothetical protein SRAE_0000000600 [Strongyloides ratti]|uniref:Uncharacterized protein n=1 Tax=Strongyloides ratti TaxID=34506 RepID=A0A090L066_STRRB|nr:Hypothetical protein SRAE_0000000600 [Strongyloides ratti]CEF60874.1 Hypothetical protein SRAE_0000000600 [Strongyloides ratti]